MKIKDKEKDVQKAVLTYLEIKKVFHYRNNSGGTIINYKDKSYFMKFGATGSPDIICVISGQYVGIEIKGTDGKQSDNQKDFQERLEKAGGLYLLVHSLDEAIIALNNLGIK